MKSKKIVIVTAVIFILVVLTFAACKRGTEPIVVTDPNGNPVTDEHGDVITVVPETEILEVTDENGVAVTNSNGEVLTTIRYIPQDVPIPVTNANGEAITNEDGVVQTTYVIVPNEPTTGLVINVPVTNEKGETQTDPSGNVVTETKIPVRPSDSSNSSLSIGKTFGGKGIDYAVAVDAAPDGGFAVAYKSTSTDGAFANVSGNAPYGALSKVGRTGREEWSKLICGNKGISINDVAYGDDGSVYVVGETKSTDIIPGHSTEYDAFIQKYSASGELIFSKGWGGTSNESFNAVSVAPDGSVYAVGFAYSSDGDCASLKIKKGDSMAVIVKFDSNGKVIAQKGIGSFGDHFTDIDISKNGDIFVVGSFSSKTETSIFKNKGYADAGVFKFKSDLSVQFSMDWGGSLIEYFPAIAATPDGGCVIAGNSTSTDENMASLGNKGGKDAVLVKVNGGGSVDWVQAFRGTLDDVFTGVVVASDGSISATGTSNSTNRDFRLVGNLGGTDCFVVRYDSNGTRLSAQGFGGSGDDEFTASCMLTSGQIVGVGSTLSSDGYLAGMAPVSDGKNKVGLVLSFR